MPSVDYTSDVSLGTRLLHQPEGTGSIVIATMTTINREAHQQHSFPHLTRGTRSESFPEN
jgi:hypothetical protein